MTWGFQLVLRVPAKNQLVGNAEDPWALPEPIGEVRLKVGQQHGPGGPYELMFRGGGYPFEEKAELAGEMLRGSLRSVSALEGFGFDFGRDALVSVFGAGYRPIVEQQLSAEGLYLVENVHGLIVYEERPGRPVRFGHSASATVDRSFDTLRTSVSQAAQGRLLTDKEAVACDLVSLVENEGSDRSRLLTLVSALEVLAERPERPQAARDLVDQFIVAAENAREQAQNDAERNDFNSLVTALNDLRLISIGASVRNLAMSTRPGDPKAKKLADRSYSVRSRLTHDGKSGEPPTELLTELLPLVREAIDGSLKGEARA